MNVIDGKAIHAHLTDEIFGHDLALSQKQGGDDPSVVKHVEALRRHEEKGRGSASLVINTLNQTLEGLPSKDRIWFVLALVGLATLTLGAYVVLKPRPCWMVWAESTDQEGSRQSSLATAGRNVVSL